MRPIRFAPKGFSGKGVSEQNSPTASEIPPGSSTENRERPTLLLFSEESHLSRRRRLRRLARDSDKRLSNAAHLPPRRPIGSSNSIRFSLMLSTAGATPPCWVFKPSSPRPTVLRASFRIRCPPPKQTVGPALTSAPFTRKYGAAGRPSKEIPGNYLHSLPLSLP